MTGPLALVPRVLGGLADALAHAPAHAWDAPSLCGNWLVRHVIAHVTMPVRLSPEAYRAELAAAGGDFQVLSDSVAERGSTLPVPELLEQLRSPQLHAWEPPGGGALGALSHAVIHSLDVTRPLDLPSVAPVEALVLVLDALAAAHGSWFGVDLPRLRLEATDSEWSWGTGQLLRTDLGSLVSLASGRTLPDGQALPRS